MGIENFTDLYLRMVEDRKFLSSFLSGHLAVEYLLRKLVCIYDPALSELADNLNHARLIKLNYDLGLISDPVREVLTLINKTRNKYAHQISYEPTVDDLKTLFVKASRAFSDMTDGIEQGIGELDAAKKIDDLEDWVIPELFAQISYDLHEEYHSRGGDVEVF